MDTFLIILIVAVLALIVIYVFFDRRKKDKKAQDPQKYVEGLKALLEGKDEVAFTKFREVVSEDSTNIDAYIRIGNILRRYGKAEKALQVHKDLTLRHGLSNTEKIEVLEAVAEDYLKLEKYGSAQKALEEATSLNGHDRKLARRLINVYLRMENWDDAFETRKAAAKLSHDENDETELAIFKYFQGKAKQDKKKYHDARVIFKEAIHIDKACSPAYINIGDSYVAENRLDDAVHIWTEMIKAVPDDAHLVLGRLKKVLFDLGKFGTIADICRDILSGSNDNLDARLTLAEYHSKKGEYDLAIEHLKKADENHPESLRPILKLARIYLSNGDKDNLRKIFDKLDHRQESRSHKYKCQNCGFKSTDLIWLCPSCQAINSFKK